MIEISIDGLMLVSICSGAFAYWIGYLVGHSCGVRDEFNAKGGV